MRRILFAIILMLTTAPALAGATILPAPYTATYTVTYRGFGVGTLDFSLRPADDGTYIYETRANPGLLARLVVSPDAVERTVVRIDESGVRPLRWVSDDGTKKTADDGRLSFDWTGRQVTGTVEEKAVALPIEAGLQDRLSMQVAVLTALLRGAAPETVTMIDEDRIKHYSYILKGTPKIEAAGDRYETVLYESTRPGSSRLKRIYHVPALGYLPARFENLKNGKVETVMELVAVSPARGASPVQESER